MKKNVSQKRRNLLLSQALKGLSVLLIEVGDYNGSNLFYKTPKFLVGRTLPSLEDMNKAILTRDNNWNVYVYALVKVDDGIKLHDVQVSSRHCKVIDLKEVVDEELRKIRSSHKNGCLATGLVATLREEISSEELFTMVNGMYEHVVKHTITTL